MKGYVPLKNGGCVLREFESQVAQASPETILREGRQRKLSLVQLPRARVFVKTFYDDVGFLGTLVRRGRFRARREFRNFVKAFELGVPVPRPIALIESKDGGAVWTEELSGMKTLRSVMVQPLDFAARRTLLTGLGNFLRDVHDRGFYHEDLHAGNLLVGSDRFAVVDMAGVTFAGKPLSRAKRIESLTIVLTSFQIGLNMTDYGRVLRAYGIDERSVWRAISRRLVELRARFVEHRAKKAEGSGSSFARRKNLLVHHELDPEPIVSRLEEFPDWTPVGEGLSARFFPDSGGARRWWIRSWKLKFNLVPAPLGLMWQKRPKGSVIVAKRDPAWLPAAGEIERPRPERNAFLGDLGRFIRRLHDLGVTVPDLHVEDLLYAPSGPERFRFALADPSRAECVVPLSSSQRARELGSLIASVRGAMPASEELLMVRAYATWTRDFIKDSFLLAVGRTRDARLERQSDRKQKGG